MRILIASDFGIVRKNERYYAKTAFSTILYRYYHAFGTLFLCLPLRDESHYLSTMDDITELVEDVLPMSKWDAVLHRKRSALKKLLPEINLVIVRCASFAANEVSHVAHACKTPILAEVMSCAWDSFWNHSLKGKLLAPFFFLSEKRTVKTADYALYVTEHFLQSRYPCRGKSIGISDVALPPVSSSVQTMRFGRIDEACEQEPILMTCAAVHVRFKGQRYVIRALPKLLKMGIRARYLCVGQGNPASLQRLAKRLGVSEQVRFTGAVSHDEIFRLLDTCDIYIQPSLQEGLPRAVIEAMSRGCSCIGAKTGGIPELLPENRLFARRSAAAIARQVQSLTKQDRMQDAKRNFARANAFCDAHLHAKRTAFFSEITEALAKTRILHVCSALDGSGGVQTVLKHYITHMKQDAFSFDFVVHDEKHGELEDLFEAYDSNIYHISPRRKHPLGNLYALAAIIKKGNYDAIHCHQDYRSAPAILLAKIARIPIRIVHSHIAYPPETVIKRIRRHLNTWLLRHTATDFWGCSGDACKWLYGKAFVERGKNKVLRNAIPLDRFGFSEETRKAIRSSLALEGKTVFGHIGRFAPQKNHALLLDIFAQYVKKDQNAVLLLIGDGVLRREIKENAEKRGLSDQVRFLGIREDIPALLCAMDIMLLPSRFEGFGMAALEAQANGLPIVVSHAVPNELLLTDGILAIEETQYENPDAWLDAIASAFRIGRYDPRDRLIRAGYDIETEAGRLEKYYRKEDI